MLDIVLFEEIIDIVYGLGSFGFYEFFVVKICVFVFLCMVILFVGFELLVVLLIEGDVMVVKV